MKKILSVLMAPLFCAACFAGCSSEPEDPLASLKSEQARIYAERSISLNEAVKEKYWQNFHVI